jgi:hypothetical protein
MRTKMRTAIIEAPAESVFQFMSDFANINMHMSNRSVLPMGSRLALGNFTQHKHEAGAMVRWKGKILGVKVDYKEVITKWIENREKEWETEQGSRLFIFEWYKTRISVLPAENGAYVEVGIKYTRPDDFFRRTLSYVFADLYINWCLKKMIYDTKHIFEENYQIHLKPGVSH